MQYNGAYTQKLTEIQPQVLNLQKTGLLPTTAGDLIENAVTELHRSLQLVVVSHDIIDSRAASVFSDSKVTVLESNYERLVEAQVDLQRADAVIFETPERLNTKDLSHWKVAIALSSSKSDMFVGVLQTGADAMDPDSFDRIVAANRFDATQVLGHDIQFFAHDEKIKHAFYASDTERKGRIFSKAGVSLEKMSRASIRYQESLIDALKEQLRYRLRYDEALAIVGRKDQVSWEELLRTGIAKVLREETHAARRVLSRHFKAYNEGTVYGALVDYLRNNLINPRNNKALIALQMGLQSELAIKTQEVLESVKQELTRNVKSKLEKVFHRVLKCIAEEYRLHEDIHVQGPLGSEGIEAELPILNIDARRALISTLKRLGRCIVDMISGAILGGIVGAAMGGNVIFGISIGAISKLIYAYCDMRDTEKNSLELVVERQLQGIVIDTGESVKEAFDQYLLNTFQVEVGNLESYMISFIASKFVTDLEAFERMSSASADDIQAEIDRVEGSIYELNQFLETLRSMAAEEPADAASESEAVAAD